MEGVLARGPVQPAVGILGLTNVIDGARPDLCGSRIRHNNRLGKAGERQLSARGRGRLAQREGEDEEDRDERLQRKDATGEPSGEPAGRLYDESPPHAPPGGEL